MMRVTGSNFPSLGEIKHEQTSLGCRKAKPAIEAIYNEQLQSMMR